MLEQHRQLVSDSYIARIQNKESKILEHLRSIEKETGMVIFDSAAQCMRNLENLTVLSKLQDKMDMYEEDEQVISKNKNTRK